MPSSLVRSDSTYHRHHLTPVARSGKQKVWKHRQFHWICFFFRSTKDMITVSSRSSKKFCSNQYFTLANFSCTAPLNPTPLCPFLVAANNEFSNGAYCYDPLWAQQLIQQELKAWWSPKPMFLSRCTVKILIYVDIKIVIILTFVKCSIFSTMKFPIPSFWETWQSAVRVLNGYIQVAAQSFWTEKQQKEPANKNKQILDSNRLLVLLSKSS